MMIIIAVFLQLGEAIMQLFKALRYPWLVPLNKYLWYTSLWAVGGIWMAAQLTRVWKFSPDPYVYTKRAIIGLFVLTVLFSLGTSRLAFYPALSLVALSLAILLPRTPLKILITVSAPLPMLRLMFLEMFPLGARSMAQSGQDFDTLLEASIYSGTLTLILIFWYLPILYHFAYTLASTWPNIDLVKRFRSSVIGFVLLLAIFGYGGYLFSFPAYDNKWRAQLQVNADYNLRSGEAKMRLIGNEYFRNVTVTADTLLRHYDTSIHAAELPLSFKADWLQVTGTDSVARGEQDTIKLHWQVISRQPWYKVTLTLRVDTLKIENVKTPLKYKHAKSALIFSWYSEPPETLQVAASFSIHPRAKLIREITAVYPETPIPVQVTAELANVIYRTAVTYRDTLSFATNKLEKLAKQ